MGYPFALGMLLFLKCGMYHIGRNVSMLRELFPMPFERSMLRLSGDSVSLMDLVQTIDSAYRTYEHDDLEAWLICLWTYITQHYMSPMLNVRPKLGTVGILPMKCGSGMLVHLVSLQLKLTLPDKGLYLSCLL
ncbi:hypothetical protein ACJX0J_035770, partial [Zea mays]